MSLPALVLCLASLALIALLPRLFFRRGRLNARWWLTAAPFFAAAAALIAGAGGILDPALAPSPMRESVGAVLGAASLVLIGLAWGTHAEPVSLWHQQQDTPRRVVTRGAYARVRHPFYLAFLLALAGCAAVFPHPLTGAALLWAAVQLNWTAAREEVRLLQSPLGKEYREYLARTGRFWPRVGRR